MKYCRGSICANLFNHLIESTACACLPYLLILMAIILKKIVVVETIT
jgi:hypothetical protein